MDHAWPEHWIFSCIVWPCYISNDVLFECSIFSLAGISPFNVITALDSRVATSLRPAQQSRRMMKDKPKPRNSKSPIIDVLVGGARGSIYFYNDLVAKLEALEGNESNQDALVGRKYHWHRRAVHTVKWSKDGMYCPSAVVYPCR